MTKKMESTEVLVHESCNGTSKSIINRAHTIQYNSKYADEVHMRKTSVTQE